MSEQEYFKGLIINKKRTLTFVTTVLSLLICAFLPSETTLAVYLIVPDKVIIYGIIAIIFVQFVMIFLILFVNLKKYLKNNYPIYHIRIQIGQEKILVLIRNHEYFLESWKNVKNLEIRRDIAGFGYSKYLYKLTFETNEQTKSLGLYVLRLKNKEIVNIVQTIDKIARHYNVFLEIKEERPANLHHNLSNEMLKINNFLKKNK